MNLVVDRPGVRLAHGDCLDVLRELPAATVNCCVTSPPYWGLRDYGVDGQLGLEATPDQYVAALVEVFREVRRLLVDDGSLWVNVGDSYNAYNGGSGCGQSISKGAQHEQRPHMPAGYGLRDKSLKPKDLIGCPWRLAFALQADGWYLRQDIIWHKPNPMPESVVDRCTKAHEYVFLLTKSDRYHFDADAISEPATGRDPGNMGHKWDEQYMTPAGVQRTAMSLADIGPRSRRNRRSVWTIATKPYPEAHFATMPPALAALCVAAGCPSGGVVLDPFAGSATTGAAAVGAGCQFVGVELNAEYCRMAADRLDVALRKARQMNLL